jgi:spoIIIJ-associated protein
VNGTAKPVEGEGETIDDAIANALAVIGVPREGLLGFGAQKARVRVSVQDVAVPAAAETPATSACGVAATDDAAEVLRRLLSLMGVPGTVTSDPAEEPGHACLSIASEAGGLLIGRHGQTLDALEYLVNRIVTRHDESGSRIVVDAEGYRARRRQELRDAARRLAARVRQTSRAQTMTPLSARERRVVHVELADDPTVGTRSVGEGQLRRVVIFPAREAPDGRRPK